MEWKKIYTYTVMFTRACFVVRQVQGWCIGHYMLVLIHANEFYTHSILSYTATTFCKLRFNILFPHFPLLSSHPQPNPHILCFFPSSPRAHSYTPLRIVPRLIKDMVPVPPDALSPEQRREPQTRRDLAFVDELVSVFGLADDEFADLRANMLAWHSRCRVWGLGEEGGKKKK